MEHEPVRGGAKDAHRQRRARIRGTARNAVVQQSGVIRGRFYYEPDDKGPVCCVGAILRGEREITWGEWLSAAGQGQEQPVVDDEPQATVGLPAGQELGARLLPRSDPRRLQRRRTGAGDPPLVTSDPALVKRPAAQERAAPTGTTSKGTNRGRAMTSHQHRVERAARERRCRAADQRGAGLGTVQAKIKAAGVEESSIPARFEIGALPSWTRSSSTS